MDNMPLSKEEQRDMDSLIERMTEGRTVLSRRYMIEEVADHPERYPCLSTKAPWRVMWAITYSMNARGYERHGGNTSLRYQNSCWKIVEGA